MVTFKIGWTGFVLFFLGTLLHAYFVLRAPDRPGFRPGVFNYRETVVAADGAHYPNGEPLDPVTRTLVELHLEKPLMMAAPAFSCGLILLVAGAIHNRLSRGHSRDEPCDDEALPTNRPTTWER